MKAFLIILLATASCAQRDPPPPNPEAELAAITDRCGLAMSAIHLTPGGELRFRPGPDARYEAVDCALKEVQKSGRLKDLPLGFVGNEAYRPEANAQAH